MEVREEGIPILHLRTHHASYGRLTYRGCLLITHFYLNRATEECVTVLKEDTTMNSATFKCSGWTKGMDDRGWMIGDGIT